MNWIEMVNVVACIVLLYFLLIAATIARKAAHKIALIPLAVMVGLQVVDPAAGWIPEMVWPSVALNVAIVFAVSVLWKDFKFK
jgi:uncharacterized membrane protein YoaK (UPF0700 family)